MGLKTFGLMAVDWEGRVNVERLRQDRLNRIKAALKKSELGALLCFDMNNIRYITATHIGTWAMDKLVRFSLLAQDDEPILWDFGSAARHHQIYCPWLGERSRAGIPPYAARPIQAPAWPKTWQKKSSWNWKNAGCTTNRSAST
jgi:Xaa-Pro aminopeptidase